MFRFWNVYLYRFSSTNYSSQWLHVQTLLATINIKFVIGDRKNKKQPQKNTAVMPHLRKTERLTKWRPIHLIGPQMLIKFCFSKSLFMIDMNSYYENNNSNWKIVIYGI
jgi:hypothetical protein